MEQVAIDLMRGPDFSSYWIERFGFGNGGFSHGASVLRDGRYLDSRSDVINGVPAGVHIRDPKSERAIYRERWAIDVSDSVYADWEANLRAKIGTPYGDSDIMDFILGRAGHIGGQWICSALAVNALQHVKLVVYPLPVEAHAISPNSLLLLIAQAGFKKISASNS